jgi:hypothetical protein
MELLRLIFLMLPIAKPLLFGDLADLAMQL